MLSKDERDENGNLTDMALALDALEDFGCDCGEGEEGTCLPCRCEKALRTERSRADLLDVEIKGLCGDLGTHKAMLKAAMDAIAALKQELKHLEEENGRLQGEVFKFKP